MGVTVVPTTGLAEICGTEIRGHESVVQVAATRVSVVVHAKDDLHQGCLFVARPEAEGTLDFQMNGCLGTLYIISVMSN